MPDKVIKRSEYRNDGLPDSPRTGATWHGESMVDFEDYLLPADRLRTAALHGWGVASGLGVSAAAGATTVTVAPGMAVDWLGRTIMLVPKGVAVLEAPPPPPNEVPMVPVLAGGVALGTAGLTGSFVVAVSWVEAGVYSQPTAPQLLHAPWLQLKPAAVFADTGDPVVLAEVTLDATGAVTALSAGARRTVDIPTGRVRLRRPRVDSAAGQPTTVGDPTVAELSTRADGGVDLTVGLPAAATPALSVSGSGAVSLTGALTAGATLSVMEDLAVGGRAQVSGALSVAGAASLAAGATVTGGLKVTGATTLTGTTALNGAVSVGAGLSVAGAASLAAGAVVTGELKVTGATTLTGTTALNGAVSVGAGLMVAGPLTVAAATELRGDLTLPGRITSTAAPEGGALDVRHRMRVRQGQDGSAGIWFHQKVPNADRAFVGMVDDSRVGLYGAGCGWGLTMDVGSGHLTVAGALAVTAAAELRSVTLHGDLTLPNRITSTAAAEGGALDVRHRMRVRQGQDASAGIWFHQKVPNADRAFIGMVDDSRVGLYGAGCGWGLTMDVGSGHLTVAGALAVTAAAELRSVTLHGDLTLPNRITSTAAAEGGALDVRHRMRVRQGQDASAGIWFHQKVPNADRAFVGMVDDSQVGLYGAGCAWGLTMDISSGRLTVAESLTVRGDAVVGAGGNRTLTVRHINGKHDSSDADGELFLNYGNGKNVNVGGGASAGLVVHGSAHVTGGLTVDGPVRLNNDWFWPSSREYKHDVTELTDNDVQALGQEALDARLVWYAYDGEPDDARPRVGLIAEDAPTHLVEEDRRSLSLSEYVAVLLAAVQRLHERVSVLESALGSTAGAAAR